MIQPAQPRTRQMMRSLNERLRDDLSDSGSTEPIAFFCECADPGCYRPVWLTLDEYRQARSLPEWVATASGHGAPAGLVAVA
jgi:hypothetical protein